MMNLTTLLAAQGQIASLLQRQPVTALAYAFSWLDPFHLLELDAEDGEDDLLYFLQVCRACFPALYATALHALGEGTSGDRLEHLLLDALNPLLPAPLDSLEQMRFGVPFEALGVDSLDNVDFADTYPRLAPVARWMAGDGEPLDSDTAATIATTLIASLTPYGDASAHHDLANLLRWLAGQSGNTLVDFTQEDIYENGMDLPDWSPADLAFLNDCQDEADQIIESALRGLARLETDALWRAQFQQNCHLIRSTLGKKGHHEPDLTWPAGAVDGAANAADPPA